ncbi:MEKHLA domain-containing protein [Coraliomargarita akajimensis]|nr:MEKHLA domain-containing protein [Coraliomargarita akajimensis]
MDLVAHTALLLDNYQRCFGSNLVERGQDESERLMSAPFVVLSHGIQPDPIFNYGNCCAQSLFELNWDQLTALPSRYSAEAMHRDERQRLLDDVRTQGFSESYRGIRISSTGKRFYIESARIWMLITPDGKTVGQAATFASWTPLRERRTT